MNTCTTASDPQAAATGLFLCGTGSHSGLRFQLRQGQIRIGSSPESDVCLLDERVSRQHAVLSVSANGVVVEDRGSTNGTYIDGHRLRRGVLDIGCSLQVGGHCLLLQRRDPEDDEVAIHFSAPTPPTRLSVSRDISTIVDPGATSQSFSAEALRLIGSLAEFLARAPTEGLGPVLDSLRSQLRLRGLSLVSWENGQPVAHAAAGLVGQVPTLDSVLDQRRLAAQAQLEGLATEVYPMFYDGLPQVALAVTSSPDRETTALVLWAGETTPSWGLNLEFVRCIGLLLLAVERLPLPRSQGPQLASGLRFPNNYVPGSSPKMIAVYDQIQALSRSDLPVIITGESGVGKEGIARLFHDSSARSEGPFVAVNCAAIPEELLEAEMFGVATGAATGVRSRPGWFREADGGTLFLDEIGDMPGRLQSKLLRALQEGEITPVGGSSIVVDVRFLSATNIDLEEALSDGQLRSDLYYRLAGFVLAIPPLRQRREDLPSLVEHFLRRFAAERGVVIRGVTVRALKLLSEYSWPGNVRQLEYELRRLLYAIPDGGLVDSASLSEAIQRHEPVGPNVDESDLSLGPRLDQLESRLIREALHRTGGLQNQAAQLLGISRNGLAKKMKRLGISRIEEP